MSTELILPKSLATAIVPKPNRREIIELLARKKHAKLTKEAEENHREHKRLETDAQTALTEYVQAKGVSLTNISPYLGRYERKHYNDDTSPRELTCVSITVHLHEVPAALKKKLIAFHTHERIWARNFDCVKKGIKAQIEGRLVGSSERLDAMLSDTTVNKALDAMLKEMDTPAKIPDANAVVVD